MPFKDKSKQREAIKEANRRYRVSRKGITPDTPEAIKEILKDWTPLIDEHGHADPARLKAHQEEIRREWCRPGNWNAAWKMLEAAKGK